MIYQELRTSLIIIILFTIITGIGYPFFMNEAGRILFPYQANGSLIEKDGNIIGSELIGQNFSGGKYFHTRPSAAGSGYDAANSSGSNLAPSAVALNKTITNRVEVLRGDGGNPATIPVDLVTASASGIDPDISVEAAHYQAMRVAKARNVPLPQIQDIIAANITLRTFNILGENRVNVLALNRALDAQIPVSP